MMEPRISIVTLGVENLDRAVGFYEQMGLERHPGFTKSVAFFQMGGMILSLFPRADLAKDMGVRDVPSGFAAIALAYNARSESEVDEVVAAAKAAGGRIVKAPERVFWGGYSGYFADTEGHVWEVAYNADFPIAEDGRIALPE